MQFRITKRAYSVAFAGVLAASLGAAPLAMAEGGLLQGLGLSGGSDGATAEVAAEADVPADAAAETPAADSAEAAETPAAAADATTEPAADATTDAAASDLIAPGTSFTCEDWTITVGADASAYDWMTIPTDYSYSDVRGLVLVGVPVTLTNNAAEAQSAYIVQPDITLAAGVWNTVELSSSSYANTPIWDVDEVQPGETATCYIYFQYTGDGVYEFQFEDYSDEPPTVGVTLTAPEGIEAPATGTAGVFASGEEFASVGTALPIDGWDVTVSADTASYQWVSVPEEGQDYVQRQYWGATLIGIPVTLTNTTDAAMNASETLATVAYYSTGIKQPYDNNAAFADSVEYVRDVEPGESVTAYIYVAYTGDGAYAVDIWGASAEAFVRVDVAKPAAAAAETPAAEEAPATSEETPATETSEAPATEEAPATSEETPAADAAESETPASGGLTLGTSPVSSSLASTVVADGWTIQVNTDASTWEWVTVPDDFILTEYQGHLVAAVPVEVTNTTGEIAEPFSLGSYQVVRIPDGVEAIDINTYLDGSYARVDTLAPDETASAYLYLPYTSDGTYEVTFEFSSVDPSKNVSFTVDVAKPESVEVPEVIETGIYAAKSFIDPGVSFTTGDYTITVSADVSAYTLTESEDEDFAGLQLVGVPVEITNNGSEASVPSDTIYTTAYNSYGLAQADDPKETYREGGVSDYVEVQPGETLTAYAYIACTGDGAYALRFRDMGADTDTYVAFALAFE